MNILLCSTGRRPYLVRWFQQALIDNGLSGKVIAADMDPMSPAKTFADDFIEAPAVTSSGYSSWLARTIETQNINFAVSINDFELSEWSQLTESLEFEKLIRLSAESQSLVEDKLKMAKRLVEFEIPSPQTWSGSDAIASTDISGELVTKGRFGSASRGLQFTDGKNLLGAVALALNEVTTRQGVLAKEQSECIPEDLLIVQEMIQGTEYGLDVVSDFDGKFATVLARKKIAMRAGETDRAVSVDSDIFEPVARKIAEAVPHRGTIDVDVMVNSNGEIYVIDINPRFGGGYPFSHLAGARVPSAYVSWAAKTTPDNSWLKSDPEIVGSKFVEAVVVA
ncbi:ATP-grasp domain-containing protein [Corynebacterium gallinarum]|uniref:ATP-grasp domain-containing protein n=1 Tax=Corynebacterium gallinarum TaxID=2762214 RepID=A0A8I0HJ59_9CORY|nr:ATP-grasp domain-containing protein [Corynebacterium gallinarum]MBD8031018.1 ATP-grasp domain-containing protein [Corynebacterium gallinarum]